VNVIVCLDDGNGMMFNQRRQSRDRVLTENILKTAENSRLWMNAYSLELFQNGNTDRISSAGDFYRKAGTGEYALFENTDPAPFENLTEQFIIYRWNRRYPSDLKFSVPLAEHGWHLQFSQDFKGYSHDKITKEVYFK